MIDYMLSLPLPTFVRSFIIIAVVFAFVCGPFYCVCLVVNVVRMLKCCFGHWRSGIRLDRYESDPDIIKIGYGVSTVVCAATIVLSWWSILFLLVPLLCSVVCRFASMKAELRWPEVGTLAKSAATGVFGAIVFLATLSLLTLPIVGGSREADHFQALVARAQEKIATNQNQRLALAQKPGKILIWDCDRGKVHNAQSNLPGNLRASVSNEEIMVALVRRTSEETIGHVYVGRITGNQGHPMKRITASVAIIQLPEGQLVGRYSVVSRDPTGTMWDLEGDIDTPLAQLVSGVVGTGK